MPKLKVRRSIAIARPQEALGDSLVDFQRWPQWSPWLCQEPTATVSYHGTTGDPGSGYAWDGARIGAGKMQLRHRSNDRIDLDLTFLKPWKSQAEVSFELAPSGPEESQVTWSMQSSLPFFLFFMRRSFERFVGMDYERGLRMLKELEETGKVRSHTALSEGGVSLPECHYLGREGSSTLAGLSAVMEKAYPELEHEVTKAGLEIDGPAFCHYTRMDLVKDQWEYIMGIPVKAEGADVSLKHRAAAPTCVHAQHTGIYPHLGNAWATVFSALRARKQKHDRRLGGFEIYTHHPGASETENPVTDIYLPVR